jgi:hypothetical protein
MIFRGIVYTMILAIQIGMEKNRVYFVKSSGRSSQFYVPTVASNEEGTGVQLTSWGWISNGYSFSKRGTLSDKCTRRGRYGGYSNDNSSGAA